MADLDNSMDLAQKLAWATPVTSEEPTQEADLSSSYLSTWNNNVGAFLSNATIDEQISKVTEIAEESMESMQAISNPNIYDEEAEARAKEREERIKAEAEAKIKAEQEAKEKEKKRAERAEQIRDFLIWKSEKDKKLWYSRWVISWILLTLFTWLLLFIVWECFFKTELVKFVDNDFNNYINWEAAIFSPAFLIDKLNISEKFPLTDNELANDLINIDSIVDTTNDMAYYYINKLFIPNKIDQTNNINITEPTIENSTNDTDINDNLSEIKIETENDSEEENNSINNDITEINIVEIDNSSMDTEINTNISQWYTAMHTNNESFANRVMAPNCDKLSCGDFTKLEENSEFTLCTAFRHLENLSDDDARIGRNWACRYRDESELYFLSKDFDYEEPSIINDDTILENEIYKNIENWINTTNEEKADTPHEESAL